MTDTASPRRKRTARFVEIAEAAGVSPATVDRVLNERASVSAAMRARVVAAARQLGVPRVLPETHHGLVHIDVLLPQNSAPFFQRLTLGLERSMQMLDRRIVLRRQFLPEADDDVITRAILRPNYKRAGLIVTTHDTEAVRDALRTVIAQGEAVVTMVTDIDAVERVHYAGIDNRLAGRTAGYFVGRPAKAPGRVLLICSRKDYHAHIERISGCREQLAESFPHLVCDEDAVETLDDVDQCHRAVLKSLKRGGVVGIYNSGYASAGIEAALRKVGATGKIVWAGHEMLDLHRQYIEQGTMDIAIDQDPDGQVISALQHALNACGVLETPAPPGPVEFRIFCSANVRRNPYLGVGH
ncbi:LacI family DNA-binding transcriptional regulator [Paraburkholderia sp. CNPSo 3274]|uniref:LacI family DNA-binding transcriptional regulator n=1 Tax=Paraburkholderia sp. CNPSo 3274 TaxID=2940932 RepID=UPI0020B82FAB|nr:LacI family DNA-binding transcriptional regulator [Paraburkholderia sp. CNPSo 3274]MCP3710884.1 LacI family DNA-binding transcriptional regulator [Paraburkholderia sp. CNPSo 3274]